MSQTASAPNLEELRATLASDNLKKQLQAIPLLLELGDPGVQILIAQLQTYEPRIKAPDILAGAVYQALRQADREQIDTVLDEQFPTGLVPLQSDRGIDYLALQMALEAQDFQTADLLTIQKLCELAGEQAVQRKWLYFTEVKQFPILDLQTIDALWLIHSQGKFGFSVQRAIWVSVNQDWKRLWPRIQWQIDGNWPRYPQQFIWDLDAAPKGHLPLSNQLRGVRVMAELMQHPAWQ